MKPPKNKPERDETWRTLFLLGLILTTGSIAWWLAQIADLLEVIANK
ncbi:hypothetical protein J7I80_04500 [Bacillus sp. ISL-41]|nr:hypothetical protein [Bacillus sp. ISL-41]MBT2641475.1 hypothetical protein [Bacillus sp. ISL-41]